MGSTGLSFTALAPSAEVEPLPLPAESPHDFSARAALAKAQSFLNTSLILADGTVCLAEDSIIISADTVVADGGTIFGKPADTAEAFHFLQKLAGKTHTVTTACTIIHKNTIRAICVSAEVVFWDCPKDLLQVYAETGEGLDKAGAYAIQGKGAFLVQEIRGSWSTVVGLPVAEVIQELLRQKLVAIKKSF